MLPRACCLLMLLPTIALAQTPRALFDEGTALYAKGDFSNAAQKFDASFAARPVPVTKFNAARSWQQAGETLKAIDAWQAWLAMSPSAPERPEAEQALAILGSKLSKLGVQALTITSLPVGARVSVDGLASGVTPLTVELTPTRHLLRLESEGRLPVERSFSMQLERPMTESFELAPQPNIALPLAAAPVEPALPSGAPKDTVEVHVSSSEPELRLYRANGNPNGECRAPCDAPITRASDTFFVGGSNVLQSPPFVLLDHARAGRVSLSVVTKGSPAWRNVGGTLFFLAAIGGFPTAFTLAISRGSQPWTEPQTIGFGVSLGVGVVGVIGMILVAVTNGTTVTFDE